MEEPSASLARAARDAFAQHGVRRTTVADVAKSAGIVRQTVYNTVRGRDELVELAILQCCEELKARLEASAARQYDDVDEALAEFLAEAVEVTAGHEELAELMQALPAVRLEELFGHSHPIEAMIRSSVQPILERAADTARLRPEVTIEDATRWLQGVLTFALLHDAAKDAAELRRVVRVFVLPSVFAPPSA